MRIFLHVSTSGLVRTWNERTNRLLDLAGGELEGRSFVDLIDEEDGEASRALLRRVRESGSARAVLGIRTRDDTTVDYRFEGTLVRRGDASLVEMEAVPDGERGDEPFRALAEHAPIGIGVAQDGVMKYLNPAYAKIFGYDRVELEGEPYTRFVHPDDVERVHEKIDRRISGASDRVQYEYRGLTRDGEERIIRVHGTAITYQGKPAAIGTLTDVTERKRLQREILEIQEEERRSIGQHLHDSIASQLSGAAMLAGVLREQVADECPELLSKVEQVIETIREVDETAWSLARGLYPTELDEEGLVSALRRLTRKEADLADTHVRYTGPSEVSAPSRQSANHLYWIAREAVSNARKHASPSEVLIRLEISEEDLLLEVSDDGSGFDPTRHRDSGLGLRTMRYRAELIEGDLTIESGSGEGTSVQCRLPVLERTPPPRRS